MSTPAATAVLQTSSGTGVIMTPIPTPAPAPVQNLLQRAGSWFKKIFTSPVAREVEHDVVQVAQFAEPFVDIAFPGIAPLYNSTVALVAQAEMMAAAAGAQNGTGQQKLAAVVSAIEPLAIAYFKSQGIVADRAVIEKWVNAVVASLNAIPAPTVAPAMAAPAA